MVEKKIFESDSRAPVSLRGQNVPIAPDAEAIGGSVTASIDGREVRVPLGTTILEAARSIGVRIPTLCHHADLCVAGVC